MLTTLQIHSITPNPASPPLAFDLPQLYTYPTSNTLLSTLNQLSASAKQSPSYLSFSHDRISPNGDDLPLSVSDERSITTYLTSIISSSLKWIPFEDSKIRIWEAASAGLAQRAGRSAAPTIERRFRIPGPVCCRGLAGNERVKKGGKEDEAFTEFEVVITEPSLTADNLGHKTWLASYLLARRLLRIFEDELPASLLRDTEEIRPRLLELGSGTGLLGIAAAAIHPALKARLTDLPEIVENLRENVTANRNLFSDGRVPEVEVLDWSLVADEPSRESIHAGTFDIVMAADPLYSPEHPEWLVNAIAANLERTKDARVIVELPLRESYGPEVNDFQHLMLSRGFLLLSQGKESGTEDWQTHSGERIQVECWWGIWKWQVS